MVKLTGATIAIVVGTAAVLLLASKASAAVRGTTNTIVDQGRGAINPAHPNNVVSRFAEWMYGGGYDDQGNIGSDLWNLLNREEFRP